VPSKRETHPYLRFVTISPDHIENAEVLFGLGVNYSRGNIGSAFYERWGNICLSSILRNEIA
jgi:hypothetical protein